MIAILVNLVVICILLAVLFWIVDYLGIWAKIPDIIRKALVCLVVLFVVLWLIALFRDGGVNSHYLLFRF